MREMGRRWKSRPLLLAVGSLPPINVLATKGAQQQGLARGVYHVVCFHIVGLEVERGRHVLHERQ